MPQTGDAGGSDDPSVGRFYLLGSHFEQESFRCGSSAFGGVEEGKLADIVALATDPLEKITELQDVDFVMKNGVVHKNTLVAEPG